MCSSELAGVVDSSSARNRRASRGSATKRMRIGTRSQTPIILAILVVTSSALRYVQVQTVERQDLDTAWNTCKKCRGNLIKQRNQLSGRGRSSVLYCINLVNNRDCTSSVRAASIHPSRCNLRRSLIRYQSSRKQKGAGRKNHTI